MRKTQTLKLVISDGGVIRGIYNDALRPLIEDAASVETRRASDVEPDGRGWSADMARVGGPVLRGYSTREAALKAETDYINREVIK